MVVYTGLLDKIQNDSTLAFLMGEASQLLSFASAAAVIPHLVLTCLMCGPSCDQGFLRWAGVVDDDGGADHT